MIQMLPRFVRGQGMIFRLLSCAAIVSTLVATSANANVEISGRPTTNMNCSGGVCAPTAKKAVLNVDDLANMLASGDVTVTSDALAEDIVLKSRLTWSSASKLSLSSYRFLDFKKLVQVSGPGSLAITTNTAKDIRYLDYLNFSRDARVDFSDNLSGVVINGTQYCLVRNIRQIAKALKKHHGCRTFALTQNYNAAKDGVYAHAPLSAVSSLEGFGHTISNLSISSSTSGDSVALVAAGSGTIRDLNLLAVDIVASGNNQRVGALVADFENRTFNDTVAGCHVTGHVTAGSNAVVGGLIGAVYGFAIVVHSSAEVTISTGSGGYAGGLIGTNYDGGILESYATGAITGGDNTTAGGLTGWNSAPDWPRGITDSYASGSVQGGTNASVGGLVGLQDETKGNGYGAHIYTSFSVGNVSANSGSSVGGVIGTHTSASSVTDAYWDLDTSGVSDPSEGTGNIANDPGIAGLSDVQLKSGLPTGFDHGVWIWNTGRNNGYPYLKDNPPPN